MKRFYQAENLKKFPELKHAFSTSYYGNLSWQTAKTKEKWEETCLAQLNFCKDLEVDDCAVISTYQNHGKGVLAVRSRNTKITAYPADGLSTDLKGVPLMVHTADCVPVFLYEPKVKAAAVVHAGWRGVLSGIVMEACFSLEKDFNGTASEIISAIGPSIGPCHFEVKEDVWLPYQRQFQNSAVFCREGRRLTLNLWEAIKDQLLLAGLSKGNIEILGICSYCDSDFNSFRRDGRADRASGNLMCLS